MFMVALEWGSWYNMGAMYDYVVNPNIQKTPVLLLAQGGSVFSCPFMGSPVFEVSTVVSRGLIRSLGILGSPWVSVVSSNVSEHLGHQGEVSFYSGGISRLRTYEILRTKTGRDGEGGGVYEKVPAQYWTYEAD